MKSKRRSFLMSILSAIPAAIMGKNLPAQKMDDAATVSPKPIQRYSSVDLRYPVQPYCETQFYSGELGRAPIGTMYFDRLSCRYYKKEATGWRLL